MPPPGLPMLPALPAATAEALLDRTGALLYSYDRSGRLLSMNRAMRDRLDLDAKTLPDVRALARAVVPEPAFRDTVLAAHDRAAAGEKQRDVEWVYTARTGDVRQVRWQFVGVGEGAERLVLVLGEDVTDRRKLEHWVRLHGNLLEQVPEAVMLADRDGRILHWTGGAEKLLGYSPRSALERPLSNIIAAEDARSVVLGWVDRAKQEGRFQVVQILRRERGDAVECTVDVARVVNERGEPNAIAVIAQPIAAPVAATAPRPEKEDAVRELDRAVSTLVSVPAVIVSPDGKVRAWSRGAERLGGMTAVKARGQRVLDEAMLVPELPWENLLGKLSQRPRHAQTVEVRRPNGSRARAELDVVALKAPDGAIDSVLLLFVDRAEADSIVAESRRTKSRAIESVFVDGVVRRLLDTLAHFEPDHRVVHARLSDMRALAKLVSVGAPMREFDQLLRRGRLGEAEKELDAVMENLGEGMSRLRMLADDVGRFAAAEASPPGPVRLSRELEAARDLLGHAFENRLSVEFVVDDLPAARAVRGPLLRGFCLLLLASLESFGPEEEGRVHIEGRAQAGFLSLEVRDNGAGYSSEVQTRIGDLDFLAAQPGYAPLFLGLAREAIRAAGGSLELGSAIGTGARVRVSFPTADQPAAPRPLEGPRPGLPVHGRILLVEEDLLLRRALERHLAEVFDVVALDSIATAVTEVQAQRYDVAVVSLPRPESFGLKLLTSLVEARAEPGRNCIVVVSPGVKHSTRERIVGLGAIVVTRPADFTTIRSICDRLIPGEVMVVADEHLAPVEGEGGEEDGDEPSGGVMPADEAPEEG